MIESIDDPRIRLYRHKSKSSIPALRNEGFDLARGKYIAIFDSDDLAPVYRLEEQFRYMEENPEIDVISGDFQIIGTDIVTNFPSDHDAICYAFLFRCYIANSAAFLRKGKIVQSHVRYRTEYFVCSDYGYWIDLIPYVRFHNLKGKPYLYYRRKVSRQTPPMKRRS